MKQLFKSPLKTILCKHSLTNSEKNVLMIYVNV